MSFDNAPTRVVDVNGTPFVYRDIGPKCDVPVVFLHARLHSQSRD